MTAQDIYGNTPLHYLAAYRRTNDQTLDLLVEGAEGGNSVWTDVKNRWGYTPYDLGRIGYDDRAFIATTANGLKLGAQIYGTSQN